MQKLNSTRLDSIVKHQTIFFAPWELKIIPCYGFNNPGTPLYTYTYTHICAHVCVFIYVLVLFSGSIIYRAHKKHKNGCNKNVKYRQIYRTRIFPCGLPPFPLAGCFCVRGADFLRGSSSGVGKGKSETKGVVPAVLVACLYKSTPKSRQWHLKNIYRELTKSMQCHLFEF